MKEDKYENDELKEYSYPLFYDINDNKDRFYHYANLIKKIIFGLVLVFA